MMARAKRESDDVYNARRRFRRQAQRYLAKAQKSSGVEKLRYEAQARAATVSAMRTYGKGQKVQGQVKKLAETLSISQEDITRATKGRSTSQADITRLIESSKSALVGSQSMARDDMAREILKTGNIGSRFYGGLVQIWDTSPENRLHPNKAILEFFGVDSLMDVLEMLEAQGINLYSPDTNDQVYKSAQLKLQEYILITRRMGNA